METEKDASGMTRFGISILKTHTAMYAVNTF